MASLYSLVYKFHTKLFSSYARIQRTFLGTKALMPVRAYILLTYRCNCACHFCIYANNSTKDWITGQPVKEELTLEHVKSVTDQMIKGSLITLTGGETTIAKDFFRIIEHTARSHKVQLMTNGTTLNREKIEKLIGYGVWIINFSIDSAVGDVHDTVRGHEGLLGKIKESIKIIREIKEERSLKRPFIHVNSIVLKESIPHVVDMVKFCLELKVDWLSFSVHRDGKAIFNYSQEELLSLREEFRKSFEMVKGTGLAIRIGEEFKMIEETLKTYSGPQDEAHLKDKIDMSGFACCAPWTSLWVTPDGTARMCHVTLGNIKKEPLQKIWNNKIAQDLRRNFTLGEKELPQKCQGCCLIIRK